MKHNWKKLFMILTGTAAMMAMTACGSGEAEETTSAQTTAAAATIVGAAFIISIMLILEVVLNAGRKKGK